jgi:hypothetical protein
MLHTLAALCRHRMELLSSAYLILYTVEMAVMFAGRYAAGKAMKRGDLAAAACGKRRDRSGSTLLRLIGQWCRLLERIASPFMGTRW